MLVSTKLLNPLHDSYKRCKCSGNLIELKDSKSVYEYPTGLFVCQECRLVYFMPELLKS